MIWAFGCEDSKEALVDKPIVLDASFSLSPPQQARAEELQLKVSQIDDSRCPKEVQCIWEGDVSVWLIVTQAGTTEEIVLTLHNPSLDGKNVAEVGAYQIALEWVSMPPSHAANWKLEDYELRLMVRAIE